MKIGERHVVKILKMISRGKGLSRLEDQVVLIPYVLPEEEVEIEIRQIRKDYLLADKISILTTSPSRIDPPCPFFEKCGGCQWQMIDYPHQLQYKLELLKEALSRIGKMSPTILPPVPASNPFHYRQRVKFQTAFQNGKIVIGFYRLESKEVIPVENCEIILPVFNVLLKSLSPFINKTPALFKTLKEISFSLSSTGKELLIEFNGRELPEQESVIQEIFALPFPIKGIILSNKENRAKMFGKKFLFNIVKDPRHPDVELKIRNSAGGFSQVNWEMNLKLLETLLSWAKLTGQEKVLELYCGNGNFTLLLAKEALWITAVEENLLSLEDLRFNLRANQVQNCTIRKGKVREILSRWDKKTFPIDLLVLDPPREGMDHSSLKSLLRVRPGRILYVSCDPATLARDLKTLSTQYVIQRIAPFDMFPQTAHIETLTELNLLK